MGHIKEPKGVDFTINSRPLSNQEKKEISSYIKDYKQKNSKPKIKPEKIDSIF
jgi:hypothetical protein